jgi:hypothetical protein
MTNQNITITIPGDTLVYDESGTSDTVANVLNGTSANFEPHQMLSLPLGRTEREPASEPYTPAVGDVWDYGDERFYLVAITTDACHPERPTYIIQRVGKEHPSTGPINLDKVRSSPAYAGPKSPLIIDLIYQRSIPPRTRLKVNPTIIVNRPHPLIGTMFQYSQTWYKIVHVRFYEDGSPLYSVIFASDKSMLEIDAAEDTSVRHMTSDHQAIKQLMETLEEASHEPH